MINANFENGLLGWSSGYQFGTAKIAEDEIKQGKNYIMAALMQSSQLSTLGTVVNKLAEIILPASFRPLASTLCNVIPIVSLPFTLFNGTVKEGEYKNFANWWNTRPYLPCHIPTQLGVSTTKVLGFFAEHMGDILRVAMIVTSVALIIFGNYFLGGAILVAMTYECLDTMGFIPRKISLFMEKYMPIVSLCGLLIGGTIVSKIIAAIILPTYLFPSLNKFIHHKIDKLFFHKHDHSLTLEEVDAPLKQNKQLNFAQIKKILMASDAEFEINPAHPSKLAIDYVDLPEDRDLGKLLPLFDKVDWKANYKLILNKLKDDNRFIEHLKTVFPEWHNQEITDEAFNICVQKMAEKNKQTVAEFAADWTKKQMTELVAVLTDHKRVKGLQGNLDDAIKMLYRILPYLSALDPIKDKTEYEDALLKLAIEGGGYCSLGIKRVTDELFRNNVSRKKQTYLNDPVKEFEQNIMVALQDMRTSIVQGKYKDAKFIKLLPKSLTTDVHAFDIYHKDLALGFDPITKYERENMTLIEILVLWEKFTDLRKTMYTEYQNILDESVKEIGETHFIDYITGQLKTNTQLSKDEKEALLDMYQGLDDDLPLEKVEHNFHRLMFVMLGVLRPKAPSFL